MKRILMASKVVSVSKGSDKENAVEDIKEYIDNIIMPSLIKFETVSAYNQAYSFDRRDRGCYFK